MVKLLTSSVMNGGDSDPSVPLRCKGASLEKTFLQTALPSLDVLPADIFNTVSSLVGTIDEGVPHTEGCQFESPIVKRSAVLEGAKRPVGVK